VTGLHLWVQANGIKGAEPPAVKPKPRFESKLLNNGHPRSYQKAFSRHDTHFSIVEVPSGLQPYRSPDFQKEAKAVEPWNYSADYQTERGRHFPP
jgi:hypothetical protein